MREQLIFKVHSKSKFYSKKGYRNEFWKSFTFWPVAWSDSNQFWIFWCLQIAKTLGISKMSIERPKKAMQRLHSLQKPVHDFSLHPLSLPLGPESSLQKGLINRNRSSLDGFSPFVGGKKYWNCGKTFIG